VARQFLSELLNYAENEENRRVLNELAKLLTAITNVPIEFNQPPGPDRRNGIQRWLAEVRRQQQGSEETPD